jgi:hypothetical protein
MLSIHAHFLWPDRRPDDVHTISIEDAARYLAADAHNGENRAAWSRRRRAMGEIAAVWLQHDRFEEALRLLEVDPNDIREELCRKINCKHLAEIPGSELAKQIADLSVAKGTIVDCFSQWTQLEVTVAPADSPHAAFTVKIEVPRTVADVSKSIDPQSWDHCSKFFCPPERTYLAHLGAGNVPVADPALPPGSDYTKRTLYEHFSCPLTDCKNATFENLLNVNAYSLSPRRQVTYDKHTYLKGSADGWSAAAVEILIDGGQLWAEPASTPGSSVVYADKTLLFRSDILTGGVNAAFRIKEYERAGELAEMACCLIKTPAPTTCPP